MALTSREYHAPITKERVIVGRQPLGEPLRTRESRRANALVGIGHAEADTVAYRSTIQLRLLRHITDMAPLRGMVILMDIRAIDRDLSGFDNDPFAF